MVLRRLFGRPLSPEVGPSSEDEDGRTAEDLPPALPPRPPRLPTPGEAASETTQPISPGEAPPPGEHIVTDFFNIYSTI